MAQVNLPIVNIKEVFINAFPSSSLILLNDYAGSGASSLIPQWSLQLASGRLVISAHPRRLPVLSLASLVAKEMGFEMGKEVGYAIRDEERGGSAFKFCTDGWLLREMEQNPSLDGTGVVIVDGIHERTLHVDVLLAKLKDLLKQRKDLKVVLIGSSLDLNKWSTYFDHFFLINVPRLSSTPDIVHAPMPSLTPLQAAVETVVALGNGNVLLRPSYSPEIVNSPHPPLSPVVTVIGLEREENILLLLATKDEVEKACEELGRRIKEIVCIPLHSGIPFDQLNQLISTEGRKCFVSTAVGDSSAFFINDDVPIVIDSGRIQSDFYDDEESVNRISKMASLRRTERRGVKKVIRLYSERDFEGMEKESVPVILRMDPAKVKEVLKGSGIDVESLDLIDKPAKM